MENDANFGADFAKCYKKLLEKLLKVKINSSVHFPTNSQKKLCESLVNHVCTYNFQN